jgi:hypothetical protein
MPAGQKAAHLRNERSAHEPLVQRREQLSGTYILKLYRLTVSDSL